MLADGNVTGAAAKAAEAIAAARSLTYTFPMALCLETAALVVLHPAIVIQPGAIDPAGRVGTAAGDRDIGQPGPTPPSWSRRAAGCWPRRRPAGSAVTGRAR